MQTVANVDNESAEPVKVNRWAIGLLMTIAALIGLAPVTFFLGRPQLLLIIFGVVATIAGLSLRFGNFQTAATYEPSFLEFLLAVSYDFSTWAVWGNAWLFAYELVYWGTRLAQFLLHVQLNADAIAFYPTVVLAGLIVIFMAIGDIETIIYELYPKTAGTRSVYYKVATHSLTTLLREEGVILLIFAFFSLVLWFLTKQFFSIWFFVALQVYLFIVGVPLGDKMETASSTGMSNAAQAISKLLKAEGYQVIPDPRTGESDTDPLLSDLDLFAHDDNRALAVDIKTTRQSSDPVKWSEGSATRMAALALDKEAKELGIKSGKVEPVMVLVGREPTNKLRAFCKEMEMHLITIPDETVVDRVLKIDNKVDLQGIASEFLAEIVDTNGEKEIPANKTDEQKGKL